MAGPFDLSVRNALAPARRPVGVVVGAGVAGALLLIAQAFAVSKLILAAIGPGEIAPWGIAVAGIFLGRAVIGWISDVAAARAAGLVGAGVRRRLLGETLEADGARAGTGESSGSVVALATRGAAAVEPYLTRYVPTLVLAVVLPPLVLVAIAVCDWWSALIVVLTLPLIPAFGILVGLTTRDEAEGQWRAMADLAGHFLDVMRGLPTLVAFRRARHQSAVIGAVTERYRERTMRTLRIAFASSAVLELVATLSVAVVAVTIGLRLASGSVSLGVALPVLLLAPEAYWPLRRVGAEFHAAAEGLAVFGRIPLADGAESGADAETSPGRGSGSVGAAAEGIGCVQVEGVSLTYPGRRVPALAPTSIELSGTGITALVGPSGGGKSTLLGIIAGELTPTSGLAHAVVGGREVDLSSVAWREQVAWLPQRPVFVAGSVADNLRLARPGASDAELHQVLARVSLSRRVGDLDASIGEDGLAFSAGERARLGLARVLLADRPWVLLDEPTAHLDAVTEGIIAEIVTDLGRRSAVVLVAHRAALVALAGRVVEIVPAAEMAPEVEPSQPGESSEFSEFSEPMVQTTQSSSVEQTPTSDAPPPGPGIGPDTIEESGRRGRGFGAWSWILEGLAATSGVALTATAGWLIVKASTHPGVLMLMVAIVGVRTFGIARPVLRYAERLTSHDRALRLLGRERVRVYDALIPLVPGGLDRSGRRRGDVLASVVDDVDVVLDRELRVRVPVRGYALMAVIATAVTALLDPVAALGVGVLTGLGGAVTYVLARHGAAAAEVDAVAARARISDRVTDAVDTAAERRRWQALGQVLDAVDEAGEAAAGAVRRGARWAATAKALAILGAGGVVVWFAAALSGHGDPVTALLILTPLALAEPLTQLADAGATAARVSAAQGRLDDLLALEPAVLEPAEPVRLTGTTLVLDHPALTRGGRTVLGELDLTLAPGEILAVSGPSGSGKSTLAALLMRFLEPSSGEIRLGGTSLTDASGDDVRTLVGLVDDDPYLFASTVAENIRFARPGAGDDEVLDALRAAHLGRWVAELPDGVHTRLGDGYADVSGGERARLGIARSMLAEQRVLVLDEPTAHLDSVTAASLVDEVCGAGRPAQRSVVWIGHDRHPDADVMIELAHEVRAAPTG
jgi:ATP-binding cassette, subfamily C, bacterial CydCD